MKIFVFSWSVEPARKFITACLLDVVRLFLFSQMLHIRTFVYTFSLFLQEPKNNDRNVSHGPWSVGRFSRSFYSVANLWFCTRMRRNVTRKIALPFAILLHSSFRSVWLAKLLVLLFFTIRCRIQDPKKRNKKDPLFLSVLLLRLTLCVCVCVGVWVCGWVFCVSV